MPSLGIADVNKPAGPFDRADIEGKFSLSRDRQ